MELMTIITILNLLCFATFAILPKTTNQDAEAFIRAANSGEKRVNRC